MSKGLSFIFFLLVFTACKGPSMLSHSSLRHIPAAILGNFKDDYGVTYTITNSEWIQHPNASYHFIYYNDKEQYFIAKNDDKNPSDGGLYSRIDIMNFQNMEPFQWGFCLTSYNAKTFEEAKATAAADRTNPRKGCGGYPFSRMKRD